MDKKIGRTQTKLQNVEDRGDLRKICPNKESTETNTKQLSERGDTVQKSKINITLVQKSSYVICDQKSLVNASDKNEDTKREQPIVKEPVKKVTEKIENQIRTYLDFEGRRRLQKRYTLKLNNQKDLVKNEVKIDKEKSSDKDEKKSVEEFSKSNNSMKSAKSDNKKEAPKRQPIIKTITIKNDNKVYKAVTFVDQKNHTPLQIKIPTSLKKKATKSTETNFKYVPPSVNVPATPFAVPSKASIKEKIIRRDKKREERKHVLSPDVFSNGQENRFSPSVNVPVTPFAVPSKEKIMRRDKKREERKRILSPDVFSNGQVNRSPDTEVAKWAPSSLNEHTKPYYEAWVNTTLTAISKCTAAEKEEIYRSLRSKQNRRHGSPELFYENFYDERYTGRIKIKTKPDTVRIGKW